jgi:hypothetical protein
MNAHLGDGRLIPLEVMPFADGTSPIEPPVRLAWTPSPMAFADLIAHSMQHDLPRLSSVDDVLNLDGVTATAYYQGYYPGIAVPRLIEDCKTAIFRAIGCLQHD